MSKHTPFTLYREKQNRFRVFVLRDDQRPIAEALTSDESRDTDNGAYIVKCLNAYPALVSALEAMLPIVKQYITEAGGCDHSVGICMCGEIAVAEQAQEAFEKAKEREA